jgi:hypothetical protein
LSAVDGTFTVNDVVISALRKSGIMGLGQTPAGDDVLDAQNDLSDMLAQWNVKTWLVWDKIDLSVTADGRTTPYTIGPAGDIPVTLRPDRVESSYIRILSTSGQPVDQPLNWIASSEDYARIALKKLVAFPKAWHYQPATPLGNILWYPWPQASLYEMHVIVKDAFPLILPLNTDLSMLPPPSRPAMKFCLAVRLRQAYGKGLRPDAELTRLAKDALETMRTSQVQVPQLVMPAMLRRPSHYNIYGDITY